MSFLLFNRPGSVVFLDDDSDYLEILAMVAPRLWHVRMFMRPARCIHFLHREAHLWERDRLTQQTMVDRWRQGKPLIPQILDYWAHHPERHGLSHVCVVDFCMPGIDGLQVMSELVDWPGARILLTGQADERVAVGAFNRGLIDQYIPKQAADVAAQLTQAVAALSGRPHRQFDPIWRATLRPDQLDVLAVPEVQSALREFATKQWTEYVMIGQPFGVLGVDSLGCVSWLQLETREGLAAMAEVAELHGVDSQGLQDIRRGRRLAPVELRQALRLEGADQLLPAFSPVEAGRLLAALYELPPATLPAPVLGRHEWLSRQAERGISD